MRLCISGAPNAPSGDAGDSLHDVQHLERRHALAVRRQFIDPPAAVVDGDRLHPSGRIRRQIFRRHGAAQMFGSLQNGGRDLAFVERVGPLLGDQAEGLRHVGILE